MPALRLYKKLGYRVVVDVEKDSQILRPTENAGIGKVAVIILHFEHAERNGDGYIYHILTSYERDF